MKHKDLIIWTGLIFSAVLAIALWIVAMILYVIHGKTDMGDRLIDVSFFRDWWPFMVQY